jgi:DNA replication protein DnaC
MTEIDCPLCRDSGLPPGNVYSADRDRVEFCACWPDRISQWAVPKANIYPLYFGATFKNYDVNEKFKNQHEVLERCIAYADAWTEVKRTGYCLSILGREPGSGKSHLASAICNHLIKTHWRTSVRDQDVCLFVNVGAWFAAWRNLYMRFPGENAERYADPLFRAEQEKLASLESRMLTTELLVLDDLSKFDVSDDQKKLPGLYNVVEHRASHCLPIVVTENADSWEDASANLGPKYGPVITDRLIRSGATVIVESSTPAKKRSAKKS